jgi:hypothetical protein
MSDAGWLKSRREALAIGPTRTREIGKYFVSA